jgi:hypothetical protein
MRSYVRTKIYCTRGQRSKMPPGRRGARSLSNSLHLQTGLLRGLLPRSVSRTYPRRYFEDDIETGGCLIDNLRTLLPPDPEVWVQYGRITPG